MSQPLEFDPNMNWQDLRGFLIQEREQFGGDGDQIQEMVKGYAPSWLEAHPEEATAMGDAAVGLIICAFCGDPQDGGICDISGLPQKVYAEYYVEEK